MRARRRPCLEALEPRDCPSIAAHLAGRELTLTGASTDLRITRLASGALSVLDNGRPVASSPFAGIDHLMVLLDGSRDRVAVDLGGGVLPGRLDVNLGRGTGTLTVAHGTIGKDLVVVAGPGTDTVVLSGLTVNGATSVSLGGGAGDSLLVTGASVLHGVLDTVSANNLTLDAGSSVLGSVEAVGGTAANTVKINGTVGRNVFFVGDLNVSHQANTVEINGSVGHDVAVASSPVDDAGYTVRLTGHVGHNVGFIGTDRGDVLTMSATARIGNNLFVRLGAGADTVTLAGTVAGRLTLDTGAGDDQVRLTSTAVVQGDATVLLGAGNDTFTFAGKVAGKLTVDGGPGHDTFRRQGGSFGSLELTGFEVV
jgi:fibronectin-binding autotransporter adhesin